MNSIIKNQLINTSITAAAGLLFSGGVWWEYEKEKQLIYDTKCKETENKFLEMFKERKLIGQQIDFLALKQKSENYHVHNTCGRNNFFFPIDTIRE